MADWFETWFDEDYALLYAHRSADEARVAVELALREAPELAQGPVLDLGCGAGRHLGILRETNPEAVGLDLSSSLLGQAPLALRPWLLRGDMRALPFKPGRLRGVCLWFTPFGYFSDGENRNLLLRISALLAPGGVVVMDYFNAELVVRSLVPEDTLTRGGIRVLSRRSIEGDRLVKRMTLTRLATGEAREALEDVRLYTPEDLQNLGAEAGLALRAASGTYQGGPFTQSSPRWIGFFEKVREER